MRELAKEAVRLLRCAEARLVQHNMNVGLALEGAAGNNRTKWFLWRLVEDELPALPAGLRALNAAIAKLCRTWAIPLLLACLLLSPAPTRADPEPVTPAEITARRVELYRERDALQQHLAVTAGQVEDKNRELRELEVREKALNDGRGRR